MNEILTLIQGVVGIASIIFAILYGLTLKRYADEKIEELVYRAKTFYAQEKRDFAESLPQLFAGMFNSAKMSALGKASGISRQLKALEKDLIAEGISSQMPMAASMSPLIAKYIQKYPILMQILPAIAQQMRSPNNSGGSSELGKI